LLSIEISTSPVSGISDGIRSIRQQRFGALNYAAEGDAGAVEFRKIA
jgi:hypothetical protein